MRPHAFAYKMCADCPAPVSRDGPIVLGWAARSVATGISRYGTRAASGAGVSSYMPGRLCASEQVITEGVYDGKQSPMSTLLPFFKDIYDACGIERPEHLPQC
jgi:hypothetical protein